MTVDQIAAIYAELKEISLVPLDPQLGFTFYADQVVIARRAQDRIGDMMIAVNRDTARVRVALRSLKEIARLGGSVTGDRVVEQISQLENEADDLKFAARSLQLKAILVRQSVFDIRLHMQVMETRLKLGEVAPPEAVKQTNSGSDTSESAMMVERFLNTETRGAPQH